MRRLPICNLIARACICGRSGGWGQTWIFGGDGLLRALVIGLARGRRCLNGRARSVGQAGAGASRPAGIRAAIACCGGTSCPGGVRKAVLRETSECLEHSGGSPSPRVRRNPQTKRPTENRWPWDIGGDDEDRTHDLRIANAALSQLSYVPTRGRIIAARPGCRNRAALADRLRASVPWDPLGSVQAPQCPTNGRFSAASSAERRGSPHERWIIPGSRVGPSNPTILAMTVLLDLIREFGLGFVFLNVLVEQAGLPVPAYPTLIVAGRVPRACRRHDRDRARRRRRSPR